MFMGTSPSIPKVCAATGAFSPHYYAATLLTSRSYLLNHVSSGPFYESWSPGGAINHFSDRDSKSHGSRRRIIAAAYSVNHLKGPEGPVNNILEKVTGQYLDE